MKSNDKVVAFRGHVYLLLLVLFLSPNLFALNPRLSFDQYLHTSWTQEEGSALPPVEAIAQTADGYLWLGTQQGLMRFDGMRFTDWAPLSGPSLPSSNIALLRPAAQGGLWVATLPGAVSRVERGRVIRYRALEKLPCAAVGSLEEDRLGRLWILNVCANSVSLEGFFPDGALRTFGAGDGLPPDRLRGLSLDRDGNLWIGTTSGVCRWSPGSTALCLPGPALSAMAIAYTGSAMAVADDVQSRVFRLVKGRLEPDGPRIGDSSFSRSALAADRDGNVWVGTSGQGLLRVREGKVDRFTSREGLSSNMVYGIVEDREGDIWVATARGLDRLRDPKVQLYSSLNGISGDLITTVFGAADGGVWIGTTAGVNRLDGEKLTRYSTGGGSKESWVNSIYEIEAGKLLVGTPAGLFRLEGNAVTDIRTAGGEQLETVLSMAGNGSATVWIADSKKGMFTIRGKLAEPVNLPGVQTADIDGLLAARDGTVWIGHYGGGIDVLCNGPMKHFGRADGLGSGPVRALYQDREGTVWAGTGEGLSRFRDSRWSSWGAAQGLPEGGVEAMLDDEAGGLWLLTSAGVVRVSKATLRGAATPLQTVLYGRTEGLRLERGMTSPRLSRSRDGRVWVCTEDGVAAIDPARVQINPIPPPVAIEQVTVDGRPYDPAASGEVAFRGRDLKITYTALSLMAPERVRFRYRLDGLNDDWTEGGSQRTVDYTNLSPKLYRFRVIASNNDGLWNNTGAAIALRVDPYFYQTTWFLALCAASVALAIWSVHRMRVRSAVARVQLVASERVRFSRELHDSLLQGFTGVVFQLEAASRQFDAAPDLSKKRLDRALDQADVAMREARQMIVSMRISALDTNSLPEALRQATAQMMSEMPVDFQFEVKGRVHQGPYDVEANLYLIAREAVKNALDHAAAKHIRLELCYAAGKLDVTVQDDGSGFDTEMALAKAGHWGFRGMRERALHVGATFQVDSTPGCGSTIRVGMVWKK